jgi:pilus assembly protein CpaD
MSSIKPLSLISALALSAALAGCATPQKPRTEAAMVPTEQFKAKVEIRPEQLLLTQHAAGPSDAQRAALFDMVNRWRSAPGGPIVVETPASATDAGFQATAKIDAYLNGFGVREPQVQFRRYTADAGAPIRVSFPIYVADIPKCGQAWDDLAQPKNFVATNFGCATAANIAAMTANPADLIFAQPPTPADAGRRTIVLEKYRAGEITSSAREASASSRAVN